MKFTINRKDWYRGQGDKGSYLLGPDGKKCCIGFVGQQCGIEDAALLNVPTVLGVAKNGRKRFPSWMNPTAYPNVSIDYAYQTNDNPLISDEEREAALKEIFASEGDEIEFVG